MSWRRRSSPSTASSRSSPSAAETARPASGRSPRTCTATGSCASRVLRPLALRRARPRRSCRRLLDELGYVGVIALELFEAGGKLLANEFAPRVHNTGHWTIDGAVTSQFENHLRAILGLPLGATDALAPSRDDQPDRRRPGPEALLRLPGAHLHLYGKEPRPGRKIGHVTLVGASEEVVAEAIGLVDAAADG